MSINAITPESVAAKNTVPAAVINVICSLLVKNGNAHGNVKIEKLDIIRALIDAKLIENTDEGRNHPDKKCWLDDNILTAAFRTMGWESVKHDGYFKPGGPCQMHLGTFEFTPKPL